MTPPLKIWHCNYMPHVKVGLAVFSENTFGSLQALAIGHRNFQGVSKAPKENRGSEIVCLAG